MGAPIFVAWRKANPHTLRRSIRTKAYQLTVVDAQLPFGARIQTGVDVAAGPSQNDFSYGYWLQRQR